MVDAAQAHADNQQDGEPQFNREVVEPPVFAQGDAEPAGAFDNDQVGLLSGLIDRLHDRREIDGKSALGRRDVRRNRGGEAVRIEQVVRQCNAVGCPDAFDVLVFAVGIGARGNRLQAGGAQAVAPGEVEQGAGDESLADLGIGAGQEIRWTHTWAIRVMTS
ncbi:hypothetical protein SDC9_141430 [bioreactor metagenome]|uniref:Uncharacterized protein n=1 Tax=bioreactor metagenome TaxID=1076179 RepID=A0A645DXM4_9ZZZZ